jgi:hypothetical protein
MTSDTLNINNLAAWDVYPRAGPYRMQLDPPDGGASLPE